MSRRAAHHGKKDNKAAEYPVEKRVGGVCEVAQVYKLLEHLHAHKTKKKDQQEREMGEKMGENEQNKQSNATSRGRKSKAFLKASTLTWSPCSA